MADEVVADTAVPNWDHPHFDSQRMKVDDLRVAFACEEFGGMLGICDETCEEVKNQVLTDEQEIVLPALKLLIGFSNRDLACTLGSKIGGLKFIALVCALATAFAPQECAQMLAKLMKCHLKRFEERHPTAEELLPLLNSMNARCQLSGFAERVVNHEILFIHYLRDRRHDATSTSRFSKTPDMDAVIKMISLLKDLQENSTKSPNLKLKAFSIQAGFCAPWIAAFLHWWLNQESMIYLEDDSPSQCEKIMNGNTKVGIKLVFPIDEFSPHYIRIRELYSESVWKNWYFGLGKAEQYGGLVDIPTYFRLMLCAFRLDRGQAKRAIVEALPYALSKARKGLTMCSGGCVARDRWGAPCLRDQQQRQKLKQQQQQLHKKHQHPQQQQPQEQLGDRADAHAYTIYTDRYDPFPPRQAINRILALVPGCAGKHMQDPRSKAMGTPVSGHPAAANFLGMRIFAPQRAEWGAAAFETQFTSLLDAGAATLFEEQVAHVVAAVLALALFEGAKGEGGLRVRPEPMVWRGKGVVGPSTVVSAVCRVFRGEGGSCDVGEWHRVCRVLAGGEGYWGEKGRVEEKEERGFVGDGDNAIISCGGGQVVWPAVLFEAALPKDGESYLRLLWRRGGVYDQCDMRRYHKVVGSDSRIVPDKVPRSAFEIPSRLTKSNMSVGDTHITLGCEAGSRGILKCALVKDSDSDGGRTNGIHVDPGGIIKTLASAERIEACMHRHDAPMDIPLHMTIHITDVGPVTINTSGSSASSLPEVYLCAPEDALPWYWDWASRIKQLDEEEDDDENDVARLRQSALLMHARTDTGLRPGAVAVVPSAGDEQVRFLALAKPVGAHVAVRQRACVECCVKYCKENGFDILVL
ncbi:uncharacterized protein F4807DRAFT_469874 [Annulohypoxylon truncatum]|uniref:uncharacterized protein n=1 Tax=Annulohypoxylon truncatum TaxID=327061 RepID=UPI002008838D|nr:uncharacterized protein F4807DRAFT_469874 [Annulohypoxylon truncatum]KAI1206853.1 hypothetical protein F4807DRAFT_469874 [Annulohypoxylon truncatum]